MNPEKEQLLYETVKKVLASALDENFPLDELGDFIDSEIMGFGSTREERIWGLAEYRNLLEIQRDQGKGLNLKFEFTPLHQRIFAKEQAAFFTHEVIITSSPQGTENILRLRLSTVFEYRELCWKMVHWHGSEGVDSDGDTWHVQELVRKNKALSQLVEEKTAELLQKNTELRQALQDLKETQAQMILQEKLASLGQLTAGIAHEIKNPLNFVNNFSELSEDFSQEIKDEMEKIGGSPEKENILELLEDVRSNLGKIRHHGSRADSIVKSMLLHSRGSSGAMEPTDLNAVIREYSNLAFHGMRANPNPINVEIQLDLDNDLPKVRLNTEDFSRVILNLAKNAFDAMRDKICAVGSEYKAKLVISTTNQGDKISIEVEDNGPGIPEEIRDKLLIPFFTTKKGTEGTGLGLSITHDIIKSHDGVLEIESEVGNFTRFRILLPKPLT